MYTATKLTAFFFTLQLACSDKLEVFLSQEKYSICVTDVLTVNIARQPGRLLLVCSAAMSGQEQYDDVELRKRLSQMEYAVTQEKATEPCVVVDIVKCRNIISAA